MFVTISFDGEAKEIAALTEELQARQLDLLLLKVSDRDANNLVVKNDGLTKIDDVSTITKRSVC